MEVLEYMRNIYVVYLLKGFLNMIGVVLLMVNLFYFVELIVGIVDVVVEFGIYFFLF